MKFKIKKGTVTFDNLIELKKKIKGVNKQSEALAKSLGTERYCRKQHCLAGGIEA